MQLPYKQGAAVVQARHLHLLLGVSGLGFGRFRFHLVVFQLLRDLYSLVLSSIYQMICAKLTSVLLSSAHSVYRVYTSNMVSNQQGEAALGSRLSAASAASPFLTLSHVDTRFLLFINRGEGGREGGRERERGRDFVRKQCPTRTGPRHPHSESARTRGSERGGQHLIRHALS